jgi:hypothetical protein
VLCISQIGGFDRVSRVSDDLKDLERPTGVANCRRALHPTVDDALLRQSEAHVKHEVGILACYSLDLGPRLY